MKKIKRILCIFLVLLLLITYESVVYADESTVVENRLSDIMKELGLICKYKVISNKTNWGCHLLRYNELSNYDILLSESTQSEDTQIETGNYISLVQEELNNAIQDDEYILAIYDYLASEYNAIGEYAFEGKELLCTQKLNDKERSLSMLYMALCFYKHGSYDNALKKVDKLLQKPGLEDEIFVMAEIIKAKVMYTEFMESSMEDFQRNQHIFGDFSIP